LVVHYRAAARYYRWFESSKVAPSEVRGLAYTACKAYGLFPVPHLSTTGFQMVGWSLLTTILLSCYSGLAPRFFLFLSFGLYFLYFGQLFCESKHGGHGSLLMPSVFIFLALSGGPQSTPWSMVFIKIFLGCIYFAGAVCKLAGWIHFRKPWTGSTMQAYLIDAMWSRPHRWKLVRQFQKFLVTRWWVCSAMAIGGLAFELGFLPIYLLGGHTGGALMAVTALAFHLSVDIVQGLDFKAFWCPVLWAFLPELQAVVGGYQPAASESWFAVLAQGFEEEPFRWLVSATYLISQVVVSLKLQDIFGKDCLPLTCCPMFAMPRNIFGDEVRACVLSEFNFRDAGYLDLAYNYWPWAKVMPITEEALYAFPGRLLLVLSTLHVHPMVANFLQPEALGKDVLLAANFEVPFRLRSRLHELFWYLESCRAEDWTDPAKALKVVAMQEECQQIFDEDLLETTGADRNLNPKLSEASGKTVSRDFSYQRALGAMLDWWLLPPTKS